MERNIVRSSNPERAVAGRIVHRSHDGILVIANISLP
jgi:hypothetical protein